MEWIKCSERFPLQEVPVIAYYKTDSGKHGRLRAFYAPKFGIEDLGHFEGDIDYDEDNDMHYWPEGWYECNENEETHWKVDERITHWMPLPEPPKSEEPSSCDSAAKSPKFVSASCATESHKEDK